MKEGLTERSMVPPKPVVWVPLLVLLGLAPSGAGLRACRVPDVLRHYRAVIFPDLQAAVRRGGPGLEGTPPSSRPLHFSQNNNLTGAGATGKSGRVGASCSAQKERSILLSIVSLGQTLRGAVAEGPQGALERAAWTVAVRTEAVMQRHCWGPPQQRKHDRGPEARGACRPAGRRLLLRALAALAACWEKLFALWAEAPGGA